MVERAWVVEERRKSEGDWLPVEVWLQQGTADQRAEDHNRTSRVFEYRVRVWAPAVDRGEGG